MLYSLPLLQAWSSGPVRALKAPGSACPGPRRPHHLPWTFWHTPFVGHVRWPSRCPPWLISVLPATHHWL